MTQPDAELVTACREWLLEQIPHGAWPMADKMAAFVRSRIEQATAGLRSELDDKVRGMAQAAQKLTAMHREQAQAVAEARMFVDREKLAKAIWEIDVENQREDDELHGHAQTEYAKWPADSSTQPYCQWAYRMADKLLERQLAEVKCGTSNAL